MNTPNDQRDFNVYRSVSIWATRLCQIRYNHERMDKCFKITKPNLLYFRIGQELVFVNTTRDKVQSPMSCTVTSINHDDGIIHVDYSPFLNCVDDKAWVYTVHQRKD